MTTEPDKSNQLSNIGEQTFKSIIETALTQSKQLTEIDLARLSGFNDDEINMLTLYWQPCFNNSWIYLSDNLILENLTNETGKDAIRNFYNQIMIPTYEEGIDYQQVSADNELVKFSLSNSSNPKKAHNKKYYLVTKKAYNNMIDRRKYSKPVSNPEKTICKRISKELGGKTEVCVNNKRIDILTDNEIIEVKNYNTMLGAIGQILYYSKFYPDRRKRIHIFNHNDRRDIEYETLCGELNISVTYE